MLSAEQTAPFYLIGAALSFFIIVFIAAFRERTRPQGLKPWVDSGK